MAVKRIDLLVRLLVKEAEHQDGEVYWAHFDTADEAATDFARYVLSKENYKGDVFQPTDDGS